jgi:hypothetical protein
MELPFVPFVGLEVYEDRNDKAWGATVVEVCYRLEEGAFRAYTTSDETLYHKAREKKGSLLEHFTRSEVLAVAQPWLDAGWEIRA